MRILSATPLLLLALLTATVCAAGVDPSAVANPYKGQRVSALVITGLDEAARTELKKGLALSQRRGVLRRKPALYPRTLEEDMARTTLWLARHGYASATVTPTVQPKGDGVVVTLAVDLGTATRIAGLTVEGWPASVLRPAAPLDLQPGQRFADQPVTDWANLLQSRLRGAGYAFAAVEAHAAVDSLANRSVHLRIDVHTGERFRIGEVEVQGSRDDLVPLVRKTLEIEPDDPFVPARLDEAELRLRQLDLFRQMKLGIRRTAPERLAVVADVIERPHRTLEMGAGYWTDELVRAHAMWRHRNLFRRGRGLQVQGSWSIYQREVATATWWPGLLGSRTRVELSATGDQQLEDSYELLSLEGALGVRDRPTLASTWTASVQFGNVDVTRKTTEVGAFDETGGTLLSVGLSWARDTADDRLDPSRGSVLSVRSEATIPGAPSDAHYLSLEAASATYHRLAPRWISASHVVVGWARPLEDSADLLPNKRFYAGGSTSMRGFARRRLGPTDDSGAPLGGEALLELSTELRFPLRGRVRGAAFLDAGQVWSRHDAIDLADLEFAIGPALMLMTPLGPVRADVGFRLTDVDPTAPKAQFHLSIGNPY